MLRAFTIEQDFLNLSQIAESPTVLELVAFRQSNGEVVIFEYRR